MQKVNHEFSIQNEDFPALPGAMAGSIGATGQGRSELALDNDGSLTGPMQGLGGFSQSGLGGPLGQMQGAGTSQGTQGMVNLSGAGQRGQANSYEQLLIAQQQAAQQPAQVRTYTPPSQGGHQPKILGGPRSRYKVEKRWSTLKRWSIRGGKKVVRRGNRWSQTGTAVSDGHSAPSTFGGRLSANNISHKGVRV